jgi:acetylornithine deacetylase/succinyl-diaminopimelate desuccinylase-like protein
VSKALDGIKADDGRTFEEQKRIAQIPSPPFGERARAAYFLQRLREVGLADAALDQEGNVIAVRKGASGKPKLVVSAHLDTVFPEGTDVTVKERDGTMLAPGIGDDARGLAALLSLIQASTAATSRRSAMSCSSEPWAKRNSETCGVCEPSFGTTPTLMGSSPLMA